MEFGTSVIVTEEAVYQFLMADKKMRNTHPLMHLNGYNFR